MGNGQDQARPARFVQSPLGRVGYRERVFWETVLIGALSVEARALLGKGRIPPLTVCLRYWTGVSTNHPRRHVLRLLMGLFLLWLYAHVFHGVPGIGREYVRDG